MKRTEIAKDYFSKKCHCSQAVLASFADALGITEETALKFGSCFGGGMRKGEVCGACTGALMALGMKFGMSEIGDLKKTADCGRICKTLSRRICKAERLLSLPRSA